MPDEELIAEADNATLHTHENLHHQAYRMIKDPRSRRFAQEFFCQWLQILDFESLDEKSERHFPEFGDLKHSMQQEAIEFFAYMVANDRSILELIDCDHVYVDDKLAKFYGLADINGSDFRRVDGVTTKGRGGILTMASILAKQSGASRTSPILRGNWLSEVILGEKLPKPPKDVPTLAEVAPDGMTERQLIELHSSNEACAKCHARIDPFGFAMENYDAIGRYRTQDSRGLTITVSTVYRTANSLMESIA